VSSVVSEPVNPPSKYRVDHYNQDRWRVRCPGCDRYEIAHARPQRDTLKCQQCNRLRGVTPLRIRPGWSR